MQIFIGERWQRAAWRSGPQHKAWKGAAPRDFSSPVHLFSQPCLQIRGLLRLSYNPPGSKLMGRIKTGIIHEQQMKIAISLQGMFVMEKLTGYHHHPFKLLPFLNNYSLWWHLFIKSKLPVFFLAHYHLCQSHCNFVYSSTFPFLKLNTSPGFLQHCELLELLLPF